MVPENNPSYLVTGATRGIGRELIKQLSQDSNATVIAGVRDLDARLSKTLQIDYPNVVVVRIDSEVDSDPREAVKKLQSLGINKVDTVFANAGIMLDATEAVNIQAKDLRQLFNVNTIAPLILFQAFKPLLEASNNPSKFVLFSSQVGSITGQITSPFKTASYGATKAALNLIMVRLAVENKNIITFAIHPGMVTTDMSAFAMKSIGQTTESLVESGAAITPKQSVYAIIKRAKEATLQVTSGQFLDVTNGQVIAW
jgi:norsolorinic acid ketoreductase